MSGKTQKVDVPRECRKGDFTLFVAVEAGDEPLHGTVCRGGIGRGRLIPLRSTLFDGREANRQEL